MNKIQETMERGVEELMKGKGWVEQMTPDPESMEVLYHHEEVVKIIKAHQTALLEAVLEEVRGQKSYFTLGDETLESDCDYNIALQDIETIINKAIGV